MKKKALLFVTAALFTAAVIAQVGFVSADQPEYAIFHATMEGQSYGPPKFVESPEGGQYFYWDLSRRLPATVLHDDPEPIEIDGYMSTAPGRPVICVCPNTDRSCVCSMSPGTGIALSRLDTHLQAR